MREDEFDQDAADRLLEGSANLDALPDHYRPVAAALEELRRIPEGVPDPAAESRTVRAMAEAVRGPRQRGLLRRRPLSVFPARVRVAVALGLVALLGTAGAAVAGAPFPTPGAADAIRAELGLEPEDELDRDVDRKDRAEDREERRAESDAPHPGQARAGRRLAGGNRAAALRFNDELRRWTQCVRTESADHEASGSSQEFDPVAACGERPRPDDFGLSGPEKADGPPGRKGPPAGEGPPARAGPPANPGPPSTTGQPDGAGPPGSAGGPPPGAGPPGSGGPPDGAGPPESAGPPR